MFTGDLESAERISEKVLQTCQANNVKPSTPLELEAVAIHHWTLVMRCMANGVGDRRLLHPIQTFVSGQQAEAVDVDEWMALAKARTIQKQFSEALNVYNQLIAIHSWFTPALSEKALLLAYSGEWEQCLDTTQRVLDVQGDNLDALRILAVHAFTQEALPDDAMQKFEDYDAALNTLESSSAKLFSQAGSLFCRICSRHPRALQLCERQLDRASRLDPIDAHVLCELGYTVNLQGRYETAMRHYREASKRDGSSIEALEGLMFSQILYGDLSDAEAQVELLQVLQNSPQDITPMFLFLEALMARKVARDLSSHLERLSACRKALSEQSNSSTSNAAREPLHEYIDMNPDFTLLLAAEFLIHQEVPTPLFFSPGSRELGRTKFLKSSPSGQESQGVPSIAPLKVGLSPDTPLAVLYGTELLQNLLKRLPGMVPIYLELAGCFTSQGKFDDACKFLRQCLALQPHCSAALVALAKTECSRFNTVAAGQALEQALSSDFSVRASPQFKLVQAMVRAQQGKADEAMNEIESLMKSDDFKSGIHDGLETFTRLTTHSGSLRLTVDDRAAVFIAHASLLNLARRVKDANKTLSEAKILFAGTPQEVQILVASSQLAVERGDYDSAIRMLEKIQDDSPTFMKAQLLKAEIMLNNNRDKEGFTLCYEQLVEKDKSSAAYSMLGEAYLRILNPEAAVDAFEQAYRLDPSNAQLRERIGKSLVATHEYHRAIDFYESALREVSKSIAPGQSKPSEAVALGHDLAKLYMKLGRIESSIRVLHITLHETPKDIYEMRNDISTLKMLFEVQRAGIPAEAYETLQKAKDLQKLVLNDVRMSSSTLSANSSDIVEEEKKLYSAFCVQLGTILQTDEDAKGAEMQYREALQYAPQNIKAMLGLAKLHKSRRNMEECIAQCKKILIFDSSNEEACILLSESLISERKSDADDEESAKPLQELLAAHPNNYFALSSLISILRKIGRLESVEGYLKAAQNANRRSSSHAGFRYSNGLYARYMNDVGKAIHEFNFARKDSTWGPLALEHMIELYLNPDQEGVWEDRELETKSDETTAGHIRIAEELLRELKPVCSDGDRFTILSNYCAFARRDRSSITAGISSFKALLDDNAENVSALLGLATGYMLEKNQSSALNILKKVSALKHKVGFNDDFEKANLLLARVQIEKASTEAVEELCNNCLTQNKSCSQAYELLGLLNEKEGDYERASQCYYNAWQLEFEASAPTGFKLAFCLQKCKRYVEAIDICEKVSRQVLFRLNFVYIFRSSIAIPTTPV